MLAACMYGAKFSGVAFHKKQSQYYDRKAYEYGSRPAMCRSAIWASISTRCRRASPTRADDRALHQGVRRLGEQGAEVILAACATVNSIIRREKINEVDGVLIMDCNAVLLKTAEGMGELYSHRFAGEPPAAVFGPEEKSLDDWRKLYNFRSSAQLKP